MNVGNPSLARVNVASENTRALYVKVLDMFMDWAVAERRYSLPANADPHAWLRSHRKLELESRDPSCCERVASLWFAALEKSVDPWSRATYVAVLSAIFARLLPDNAGYLALPFEPDELMKPEFGDSWLALLAPTTALFYRTVFDYFWEFAESRYRFPVGVDRITALREHRRLELTDPKTRGHCEGVVRDWIRNHLEHSDMEPSSVATYSRVIRSFFAHLLPYRRGRLR